MSEHTDFTRRLRRNQTDAETLFWDETRKTYDQTRTEELNDLGYRVIRFTNADIYEDLGAVLNRLHDFVGQS